MAEQSGGQVGDDSALAAKALQTQPEERDLRRIADNCGDNWKSLLTYVGLKNSKIKQFKIDENASSDACFQGLVYWLGGNVGDPNPVNWSTLLTAMKEAGMASDAREWKQKIIKRCAASLDKPRNAGQSGNDKTPTPEQEEPRSNVPTSATVTTKVPTAPMAGMEDKIDSSLDICGVEEYNKGLIGNMAILGAVLGIGAEAKAIINRNGTIDSQLLEILDVYIARASPTWGDFCTALKRYHGFNKVRVKIQRDHHWSREEFLMEQDENVRKIQKRRKTVEVSASNAWLKQYEKVIQEQGSVSVQMTRCVLIGPVRVGKSSLKQLLVHNEPRPVHKSTDMMEAPVVLTSMYHSEKSVWKVLTVDNLLQGLNKCTAEGEYNSESPPHQSSTSTIQKPHLDSGSIQSSGTVPEKDNCPDDLNSRLSRFVEHLQSVGHTDLKMNGLKLIHLFDCGGQLAFQDAIPCLIHAPSAFIVVFNASVHLEEEKEWTYCPHEGSEELGRGHKESQWNILLRIFSSIHSLQYKCHADLKKLTQHKSSNQDEPSNSWPIAVVGTHKAILNQHEDCANINKSIISHFADLTSKPYCDLFISETPDLVENTTMDDAHRINELREQISKYASFSLKLPLTWLYLELFTRNQHPKQLFIRYKDLKALCVNGKLITNGDDEFNSLLRVLHALGFYAFFPLEDLGVPLDQNWVCTDAATLYREVSKLLMVQYTLDNPKSKAAEYLKSEGMIVLNKDSDLRKLFNELKIGKINGDSEIDRVKVFSPKWLILVLVYIGLAAKFKRGGIEQVFIPLALPFRGSDLPPVTELSIAILCLTLEFPSGPSTGSMTPILTDMPCGIFPRLVVLLLSEELKFDIFAKDSDRACVKLRPPDHKGDYRLYLKNCISYVEVALQVNEAVIDENHEHEAAKKVYKICDFLRHTLTSSLEDAFFQLFGEQPRGKAVTARCGFKCTFCPASENDHLTVMGDLEPQSFSCVFKQGKCPLQSRNYSQRIWFCSVPAAKFSVKTGTRCRIWVMDNPSSSDLHLPDDSSPPSPPTPPPPPPTWTEQYKKAIKQRGSVTVHITRCVLLGPPRVGKSSLKLLLINNEPPDEAVEKSTDLMEAPVVLTNVQCQENTLKGTQWKELTQNNLQQLVSKCTREGKYNPTQHHSPIPLGDIPQLEADSESLPYTSQLTPEGFISHKSTAVASDTDNVLTTVTKSSNTFTHLVDSELEVRNHDTTKSEEESKIVGLETKYNFFIKEVMSEDSLAELEINGLKMVHVFDCGGQLAFQDTIPLLINAPCAFLTVFNASIDLDEEVELKYCPKKGEELGLGHKESQWNMLRRIFSSIHSLQFKCHGDIKHLIKKEENSTTAIEEEGTKVLLSSPIAVVGTHKDVLCKAGELRQSDTVKKIKGRFDQLRDSKLYDFLREGCTHDLVANLSKDDLSAIESLRNDIMESKATLPLELPLSWITLELFTRSCHLENKFIPFLELQQLCFHHDIVRHKEEFSSLLQVLHVLGFYAFYQLDEVPEDENWVCTDAATLYREVTKMLMVQYKKNLKKKATIKFQNYGRIELNKATLDDIFTDLEISIGGADPMWFIRVLLHIGLSAKIKNDKSEEVFIPLALPFKHSDLPPVTSVATVCFTLEFLYEANEGYVHASVIEIPRGIFPRLIVYLLSQQGPEKFKWLVDKGDSRSRIKLIHSREYLVYLGDHVDHIELDLVLNDTFFPTLNNVMRTKEVGRLCQELREHLILALHESFVLVFGHQPPERKPTVVYGLKCSSCRDSSHMAIVQPAEKSTPEHPLYTEKCVHKPGLQFVKMPDQLIWLPPVEETTFEKNGDEPWQWVIKETDALDTAPMARMGDKIDSSFDIFGVEEYNKGLIGNMAMLGAVLGIEEEAEAIINRNGKIDSQLLEILKRYIAKESPTWGDFCTALKRYYVFNNVREKIERDHHSST